MQKKRVLGWLAIVGVGTTTFTWLPGPQTERVVAPAQANNQVTPANPAPAESRLAALPQRETLSDMGSDVFSPRSWAPPSRAARPRAPMVVAKPAPPPMPYRVAGKMVREGGAQIVLAKGDRLFTVREGDTLEDGYRVEAIASDRVTLLYVPLGARESIRVTTVLPKDLPLAADTAGSPGRREMDHSSGSALADGRIR